MTNLTSVFIFVPGALEAALFLIIFLGLLGYRRRFTTKMIPESMTYAFLLRFLFQIGADLIRGQWNPWLLLLLLVLSGLCFAFSRAESKGAHWSALLVSMILYFGAFQTFTYVKKVKTESVIWEIDESTQSNFKQETVMHFQYEAYPNHGFAVANSAIANILRSKGGNKTQAQIQAVYHWGAFAGYEVQKISEVPIPLGTEVIPGCDEDCTNPPFPPYSF